MPYNGRYYCNSIPKYKILVTTTEGVSTAKVVSVTTFSMAEYYEIFDEDGEPFTDKTKAERIASAENKNNNNKK